MNTEPLSMFVYSFRKTYEREVTGEVLSAFGIPVHISLCFDLI